MYHKAFTHFFETKRLIEIRSHGCKINAVSVLMHSFWVFRNTLQGTGHPFLTRVENGLNSEIVVGEVPFPLGKSRFHWGCPNDVNDRYFPKNMENLAENAILRVLRQSVAFF